MAAKLLSGDMKWFISFFSGIIVALGIVGLCQKMFPSEPIKEPVEIVRIDTLVVHKVDTLKIKNTVYHYETIIDTLTILVPIPGKPEPIGVDLMKVQREFVSEKYKAWVSGVDPSLDSLDIYQDVIEKTITITEREKTKRWGFGIQAGMTYDLVRAKPSPYIGVGVSYNLIRW